MIRGLPTTIVCACLAGAIGVGLFFIKHEVKEQEARLAELNQEIQSNQEAMHVLKAEWSYLNDPARLRALSEKHLAMKVMGPSQIASLDTLPVGAPVYAARAAAANAVARAEAAPTRADAAPVLQAAVKPAPAPVSAVKTAPAPAKPPAAAPTKLATVKPAAPAPAPSKLATVAKPAPALAAKPVYEPAPRLAAAPAPQPVAAAPAPVQRLPAAPAPSRGPASPQQPGRSIIIQSPALASTPAPFGEVR